MDQAREISDEEYIKEYTPCGAWVLVMKDMLSEKFGRIILPDSVRALQLKYANTGIIVKMPVFNAINDEETKERIKRFKVGDRVGFGATVPALSPAPPYYHFNGEKQRSDNLITLHIDDIIGYLGDAEEFASRFKES